MKADECEICRLLQNDEYRITETSCWDVRLAYQQMRPGRCMTILKRHTATEIQLTDAEWMNLRELRSKLHPAILQAYGATHLNTFALNNGAWKQDGMSQGVKAHLHYWDVPRYLGPCMIGEALFEDSTYPHVNADEFTTYIPDISLETRKEIIRAIQERL